MFDVITCHQCGGPMFKGWKAKYNQITALAIMIMGAILSLVKLGRIIGVPLIVIGTFMLVVPQRVWKCKDCYATLPRSS